MLIVSGWWLSGTVLALILLGEGTIGPAAVVVIVFFFAPFVHLIVLEQQEKAEWDRRMRAVEIADVDAMSGREFELYVERLLINEGYKTKHLGGPRDFGADIVAEKDGIRYAVQIKRYSKKVPRRAVSDAVAAKETFRCSKAMVITNNFLSKSASEFADRTNCEVIDRYKIADLINRYS